MDLQTIIFIGRPGSGKGTQSALAMEFIKKNAPEIPVMYFETGSYFRKYIKEKTGYTWDQARHVLEVGGRQPDFLAVWIWSEIFINEAHGSEHFIFDGMPRSFAEAKILETAFPFYKRESPAVVFIDVSHDWAESHLQNRGRADDKNPEVIEKRLSWYEGDVLPAINYYRENPLYRFLQINGEQTPEQVSNDVLKALGLIK